MTDKNTVLPKDLTQLVNWSVSQLGDVIREQQGQKTFLIVEQLRKTTKLTQNASANKIHAVVEEMKAQMQKLPVSVQHDVAHAFGMMLELINVCEAAYRSYRLKSYSTPDLTKSSVERITYVLTAHPTEAKTIELIECFDSIQDVLVDSLIEGNRQNEEKLKFWLSLAWRWPMAKHKKPAVRDEAEAICTIALKPKILDRWIKLYQSGHPIFLRTWVGGDKDGHPGVDEITLRASLNTSRKHMVAYLNRRCELSIKALSRAPRNYATLSLISSVRKIKTHLKKLESLDSNDGARCQNFSKLVDHVNKVYKQELGIPCYYLQQIQTLVKITPALVIPLELREDSGVVAQALEDPKRFAIGRMLLTLQKISGRSPTEWYAQGFILSMTESTQDLINGVDLVRKTISAKDLPVVPLFENEKALLAGPEILKTFINMRGVKNLIRLKWHGAMEVMVGYSDSSKENGALRSRQLIETALFKMEKAILKESLQVRFFHGSGGSVARGGGSIEDQTSWWPKSAQTRFKATIQGEMIGRSFSSPEVFTRQASRIMNQSSIKITAVSPEVKKSVEVLALATRDEYRKMVTDENFMKAVSLSTPYNYLQLLKIGSRPSKRKQDLSLTSLRAIPWILCWTQTRVLFPAWWGLGSAWSSSSSGQKNTFRLPTKKVRCFDPMYMLWALPYLKFHWEYGGATSTIQT